ncbi:NblA/ycf18 family protein [Lyngbya confervoides]|uniref:NblA/ycf18 family protein n=1 Tax=Lyngbya confervoides BDU141951 TaxID=1574623 RepID=A0ABD4T6V3_9CYAN|nr:NblA/ycf18 family protein [Lyngbya confervoides]MCM1984233.1 NblA/ycf18 family protein [Lyngbya confervoides BDU141951]
MNPNADLPLEQQFKVKVFADQIQNLSKEEVQELVVDLYQNSLVQERLFKQMMGEYLGLSQSMAA